MPPAGLEPATSGSVDRRSIRLSYGGGVSDGSRSRDLLGHIQALCQLSYRHRAPGRDRTGDLPLTRRTLWPSELRGRVPGRLRSCDLLHVTQVLCQLSYQHGCGLCRTAAPPGLEPGTSRARTGRNCRLCYGAKQTPSHRCARVRTARFHLSGAGRAREALTTERGEDGTRTRNRLRAKQERYQLRHLPGAGSLLQCVPWGSNPGPPD